VAHRDSGGVLGRPRWSDALTAWSTATGCGFIEQAERVGILGEPGTGKAHLACALGEATAGKEYTVRFITAARPVTELVEARDRRELNRVVARYARVDLLILDELAYVPLTAGDAELLFRVLGERQEQWPIIVTTNLSYGEWTKLFPDPRLCRAVVGRLTHIRPTSSIQASARNAS
jgi:DNA replication protein DnaC